MLRKIRYALRRVLRPRKTARLERMKKQYLILESVFKIQEKYEIDLLIRPYAHLNAKNNLDRVENDLKTFSALCSKTAKSGEFSVGIRTCPKVISEGIFSFALYFQGSLIYSLSFSILDEFLLICCAQGYADVSVQKAATKAAFGLRPINLALHVLNHFANSLNLTLAGVKNSAQISSFKRKKYEFVDYDELWRQNASSLKEYKDFFAIKVQRKNMDEIASKKRSEYRKRYALLDELIKEFDEIR